MSDSGEIINVYCDESCHLEHDRQGAMSIGCVWAPRREIVRLNNEFKQLKKEYGAKGELKWTKVSPKQIDFYLRIVDWFFAEPNLHFRALVVPDKTLLDHEKFNKGSQDSFYYKMYFSLLNKILSPDQYYNILIDKKDTRSRTKIRQLREILCNDKWDFTGQMIINIRHIHSDRVPMAQLTDFLLGALSYRARFLDSSEAKTSVIRQMEKKRGRKLLSTTSLQEQKFNVFIWQARKNV